MIKSRFSARVYGWSLLFIPFIGIGLYWVSHPGIQTTGRLGIPVSAAVPGAIFLLGMGGIYAFLLKNFITVRIGPDKIVLRSAYFGRTLPIIDIQHIDLAGSEDLTIITTNDMVYTLRYEVYRNMARLKRYLRDNYAGLADAPAGNKKPASARAVTLPAATPPAATPAVTISPAVPAATHAHTEEKDSRQVFAGNFFTSQNGISVMGFAALFLWGIWWIRHQLFSSPWPLLLLAPVVLFYFAIGRQLYYFRLDGEQLEIVNYLFFGYKKIYRLEQIVKAALSSGSNESRSLEIRTKDFEYGRYGAGTLRKRDWEQLHKALKARHVPVSAGWR